MQYGSGHGPRQDTLPNAIIQDDTHWSALHTAAADGDEKKLQALLDGKALDRSAKETKHGNSPLHEAAWRGYSRCVKALCLAAPPPPPPPAAAKSDRKPDKAKSKVAAAAAAAAPQLDPRGALRSLLLNIQNNGGFTALHLAAQNGHNQSCRELLWAGADPDVQNYYGDTALHTACRYGHAGATRILLSALCDPNRANLNGDAPLHISCAMGRRKLTRILLEAECDLKLKNGQDETPRDIALRKHYGEILEILNNPRRMRNRHRERDKQRPHHQEQRGSGGDCRSTPNGPNGPSGAAASNQHATGCGANGGVSWSPYGCHYFPDPRTFPSPKLETLPKEPLQKGEQYYLDLAGNIRKGPVGVGNTCYCGPFFRHIEDKLNANRKKLRKYVHKAKESLDHKVQALALQTNDQIEQLTRSMIADRVRCESRRRHLDNLLRRGDPLRLTAEYPPHKAQRRRDRYTAEGTLTRCRSLELLDSDEPPPGGGDGALANAKSCGLLEQAAAVTVHRHDERSDDEEDEADDLHDADSLASAGTGRRLDALETDYYNISQRFGHLLARSHEILEMERRESRQRLDDGSAEAVAGLEAAPRLAEELQPAALGGCPLQEEASYQYLSDIHKNESMLQSVISALRKDHQRLPVQLELAKSLNDAEPGHEDKLSYKEEQKMLPHVGGLFQNSSYLPADDDIDGIVVCAASRRSPLKFISAAADQSLGSSYALAATQPRKVTTAPGNAFKKNNIEFEQALDARNATATASAVVEKFEIKNSEIKLLKKAPEPEAVKRSKVQEVVARLQGRLSLKPKASPPAVVQQPRREPEPAASDSESSEDEQNNHNETRVLQGRGNGLLQSAGQATTSALAQSKPHTAYQPPGLAPLQQPAYVPAYSMPLRALPERIIPKDAYFHDLSHKQPKRQPTLGDVTAASFNSNMSYNHYVSGASPPLPPLHANVATAVYRQPAPFGGMRGLPQFPLQSTLVQHRPPPPNDFNAEKLLTHRKFKDTNAALRSGGMDYELSRSSLHNSYQQLQRLQQFNKGVVLHTEPTHLVERDISNDSGFSVRTYGGGGGGAGGGGAGVGGIVSGSHRPSPNLSLHSNYTSEGMQSPTGMMYAPANSIGLTHMAAPGPDTMPQRVFAPEFNSENVSSLV